MAAAVATYRVEEEELWKCPKHPLKRQRNGVCPTCLRDRLVSLCPNCGNVRPCPCVSTAISSSSTSSSSSSSGGEPSFRRSRSLAVPFLRSNTGSVNTPSFLSVFRRTKANKGEEKSEGCNLDEKLESNERIEDFAKMITRSRSVSVGTTAIASGLRRDDVSPSSVKGKFWHFPSRMKAFRGSKPPKFIHQDRSPLPRG